MRAVAALLLPGGCAASGVVAVPGGRTVPAECVHEVASGSSIDERGGVLTVTEPGRAPRALPRCAARLSAPRHGGAWKTWAQYKPDGATSVTHMSNDWKVPPAPASDVGQILYYWNGLEDGGESGGSGVLQPVLQFTGGSWGIKSWYVGAGGTVTSDLVKVAPGDVITGLMTQRSDGTWTCRGGAAGGTQATLHYTGQDKSKFTHAYEVLEAYSVSTNARLYPSTGSISFTNTTLHFDGKAVQPPYAWKAYSCPSGPGCDGSAQLGETTTVEDGGVSVTIHWNTK